MRFFCAFLHICIKHVASCRPGEVLCGNGQCKSHSSQCVSTCADSSEEGTCGEQAYCLLHVYLCAFQPFALCHILIGFQEVNATMCVPTRSVCQSLQFVMVSLTVKIEVMSSTAPEHVSTHFLTNIYMLYIHICFIYIPKCL